MSEELLETRTWKHTEMIVDLLTIYECMTYPYRNCIQMILFFQMLGDTIQMCFTFARCHEPFYVNIVIHCRGRITLEATASVRIHGSTDLRSKVKTGDEKAVWCRAFVLVREAEGVLRLFCSSTSRWTSRQRVLKSRLVNAVRHSKRPSYTIPSTSCIEISKPSYRFYATMERTPNTSHTLIRTQHIPSPYLLILRATVLK